MREKRPSIFAFSVIVPLAILVVAILAFGDYALFAFLNQQIANPILDFACTYASPVLFSGFYVLTFVTLLLSKDSMSNASGAVSILNGLLSYGVGSLIKDIVRRPRPEALVTARVISEARLIGLWHADSFSFPSTTAMLAFGLALPILLAKPRYGAILVVLSYFLGFAVIYTGFHFPLDVAAGILFSIPITLCTDRLKKPIAGLLKRFGLHKAENTKA